LAVERGGMSKALSPANRHDETVFQIVGIFQLAVSLGRMRLIQHVRAQPSSVLAFGDGKRW